MIKKLPTHECTLFVDDIREEVNGKLSLIGLYGLDLVLKQDAPIALSKLCIVTRVFGGDGEAVFKFSMKDPEGAELLDQSTELKLNLRPNTLGNLNLILSPFPVNMFGKYKFTILLEEKEFHTTFFEIKHINNKKKD